MTTKLEPGMLLRAVKALECRTTCWDRPLPVRLEVGSILQVPSRGTRDGSCHCQVVDATMHTFPDWDRRNPQPFEGIHVSLSDGWVMQCPWGLGSVTERYWKIQTE